MANHDPRLKARAHLAWKADRAFGLAALPIRPVSEEPQISAGSAAPAEKPTATSRPPSAAPGAVARPAGPAGFFGEELPKPAGKSPARAAALKVVLPAPAPISAPALSADEKRAALLELDEMQVRGCTKCELHHGRTQTVFGEGDPDARIMFIGEGPGENEDLTGRPFVGRAGELLDRMITRAMGLRREDVFICNIVKCRPPGNRAPMPEETAACTPYLERQIEVVRPEAIITLGAPAAKYILRDDKISITRARGTWREYRGIKVMPTFHPAYILRVYTDEVRRQVWSDLQAVLRELSLPIPGHKS